VAHAAQHPERISHLILHGGYARGWLMRDLTDGQIEELRALEKQMRTTVTSENAVRLDNEMHRIDVRDLAAQIPIPTLI
jgi:hypothetical protein